MGADVEGPGLGRCVEVLGALGARGGEVQGGVWVGVFDVVAEVDGVGGAKEVGDYVLVEEGAVGDGLRIASQLSLVAYHGDDCLP